MRQAMTSPPAAPGGRSTISSMVAKMPERCSASSIGVVHGVLGIRWFDCTVTGMEAHAGPTPMALRKDAMQVATHLMQEVVATAMRHQPHGRGTVGMVHVHPNSRNVIPGRVKFSIDLRNSTDALVDAMVDEVRACAKKLEAETGLAIQIDLVSSYPAQGFHPDCISAVERAADRKSVV